MGGPAGCRGWQAGEGRWDGALQFALVLGTVHPTLGPAQFILQFAVATLGVGLGVCARSNCRQEAPWTRVAHVRGACIAVPPVCGAEPPHPEVESSPSSPWCPAEAARGEGRGAERCSKLAQAGGPESWAALSLRVLGRGGRPARGLERGAHRCDVVRVLEGFLGPPGGRPELCFLTSLNCWLVPVKLSLCFHFLLVLESGAWRSLAVPGGPRRGGRKPLWQLCAATPQGSTGRVLGPLLAPRCFSTAPGC